MELTKSAIKKQMHIEAGEVTEVIDVKMQIRIEEGGSYEDIRMLLQKKLERRFNELFRAELGLMPARVKEGERWKQIGLFEEV